MFKKKKNSIQTLECNSIDKLFLSFPVKWSYQNFIIQNFHHWDKLKPQGRHWVILIWSRWNISVYNATIETDNSESYSALVAHLNSDTQNNTNWQLRQSLDNTPNRSTVSEPTINNYGTTIYATTTSTFSTPTSLTKTCSYYIVFIKTGHTV